MSKNGNCYIAVSSMLLSFISIDSRFSIYLFFNKYYSIAAESTKIIFALLFLSTSLHYKVSITSSAHCSCERMKSSHAHVLVLLNGHDSLEGHDT